MTTTPQNLQLTDSFFESAYPNVAGNTIHSGDMVWVDTSTADIKALDTDAHAAYFVGVSNDTYDTSLAPYANPPVPPVGMSVQRRGRFKFYTTNAETYTPGTAVYIGANAQTVTLGSTATTHKVGYVSNLGDNSQESLAGTGTNTVVIDIAPAWPIVSI